MDCLPDDCILVMLSYLSYDEISKLRVVNKRFNSLCGQTLNNGFKKVKVYHGKVIKEVKAALPRRESERRKHALYPRRDILQAIETRLSLLTMTYGRFIAEGSVCFIPGKVLDELYRLLQVVHSYSIPLERMSVPLLQELRDISSMAMEHFDEHIVPNIERNEPTLAATFTPFTAKPLEEVPCPILSPPSSSSLKQRKNAGIAKLRSTVCSLERKNRSLEKQVNTLNITVNEQKGQIVDLEKQIRYIQSLLGVECRSSLETGASGSTNTTNTQTNEFDLIVKEFLDAACESPGSELSEETNSSEGRETENLLKRGSSDISDLQAKRPKL